MLRSKMSVQLQCDTCGRFTGDLSTLKCKDCHILPEYIYLSTEPWIKDIRTAKELILPRCNRCKRVAERSWFEETKPGSKYFGYSGICCICRGDYHKIKLPTHIAIKEAIGRQHLAGVRARRNASKVSCICGSDVIQTNMARHLETDKHKKVIAEIDAIFQSFEEVLEVSLQN